MDVTPDNQNIDRVFSGTTYHIDFYQRDYRWTSEPVERLLDDVFFKFNEAFESSETQPASTELIDSKFPWYYLNTYVTNKVDGRVFVVDGQQRLTTLTLISIKLFHLAKNFDSELRGWIEAKVSGQEGFQRTFWMNHVGHESAMIALFEGKLDSVDTSSGVTAVNMEKNFQLISRFLDKSLHDKNRFEKFALYFFRRLVLINLAVEQTDVPMVFEVINDRGVRLKPFEIMKGKLLGQIDKISLEKKKYNKLWEDRADTINSYYDDEFDEFFRNFLKARFADNRRDAQRFDGDYHRIVFSNDFQKHLSLSHNPKNVSEFLDGPFLYYSNLYEELLRRFDSEEVFSVTYNRLNDIDGAFILLMSACSMDDPEEGEKLHVIPSELDRMFSLLQLQGAYDSNAFQEAMYKISTLIRDKPVAGARAIFDQAIMDELSKRRATEVKQTFQYSYFRQTGIGLNARFKRYFFARVEEFLSSNMKMNIKHELDEFMNTGTVNGFHIEHILSNNQFNLELFDSDQERFEQERNRLGGLLLLKGKDNISSGNEVYQDKLKTYAGTLFWNETLREDTYKSKLDFKTLREDMDLDFEPFNTFGAEEVESRQKLLFKIATHIWK